VPSYHWLKHRPSFPIAPSCPPARLLDGVDRHESTSFTSKRQVFSTEPHAELNRAGDPASSVILHHSWGATVNTERAGTRRSLPLPPLSLPGPASSRPRAELPLPPTELEKPQCSRVPGRAGRRGALPPNPLSPVFKIAPLTLERHQGGT